ncbi:Mediator complex, subunit Med21/Med9 [Metarhizium album ARSEF 1941]|uniref:Mediator of RNA polymerase II transcription subunit 21 n=1 Tax=Metarhizium album (strain ARSEF 1941) TaxID=1081103 RepID=A0A0B2WXL5_METAS|nr:Mediator complex, subunit Med21/Med9 [Metarhizium album ARSEF 1941]KHN98167.1 Mediator complex, subunit Med21/Med9 [Metarhizium album ARSEF 1941]
MLNNKVSSSPAPPEGHKGAGAVGRIVSPSGRADSAPLQCIWPTCTSRLENRLQVLASRQGFVVPFAIDRNPSGATMGDRLTQLQDAVDQFAQQFVACLHFVQRRHDLETLGPNDKVRDIKQEPHQREVDPLPADELAAGLKELSRDLIIKEQQIEVLISNLPGLDNSERDQERNIKDLEEKLKAAEAQRQEALKERDQILAELDSVIRSIRRP